MKNRDYQADFNSWNDVCLNFDIPLSTKEPSKIWARYDKERYNGSAEVLFKKGRKWYYVNASHCSCYGLEGQWEPEEFDVKLFLKSVEDRSSRKMLGLLSNERSIIAWLKEKFSL